MNVLVYTMRADEEANFRKFGPQYGVELSLNRVDPCVATAHLADGFSAMSIITTALKKADLAALYEHGIRFISTRSIGTDHIDMPSARELGIRIGNVSYASDAVSNYTVMLLLMALRNVKNISILAKAQDFTLEKRVQGRNLNDLTVGVVGTGRIGARVIEHLHGFGCKILAYDKFQNEKTAQIAKYVEFDELLAQSDIVTLHMTPGPENFHLINDKTIAKMKDGVILVNTARGLLVDTEALIRGVESEKIASLALDVVEDEFNLYYKDHRGKALPNRQVAILKAFPNVILLPHAAFYTDRSVANMVENSLKSCIAFQKGEENPWEVLA